MDGGGTKFLFVFFYVKVIFVFPLLWILRLFPFVGDVLIVSSCELVFCVFPVMEGLISVNREPPGGLWGSLVFMCF